MVEKLGYESAELVGKSSGDLAYDGWRPTADAVLAGLRLDLELVDERRFDRGIAYLRYVVR